MLPSGREFEVVKPVGFLFIIRPPIPDYVIFSVYATLHNSVHHFKIVSTTFPVNFLRCPRKVGQTHGGKIQRRHYKFEGGGVNALEGGGGQHSKNTKI